MRVAVATTAAAALTSGCAGSDHARPVLRRAAAAAWCPSIVLGVHTRKFSDARHGAWDARAIIGLDLDEASRMAARHGCQLRLVGGKDADPHDLLTKDFRFNRINVDATDGVVTTLDGDRGGDVVG